MYVSYYTPFWPELQGSQLAIIRQFQQWASNGVTRTEISPELSSANMEMPAYLLVTLGAELLPRYVALATKGRITEGADRCGSAGVI